MIHTSTFAFVGYFELLGMTIVLNGTQECQCCASDLFMGHCGRQRLLPRRGHSGPGYHRSARLTRPFYPDRAMTITSSEVFPCDI